jgi:hypothetical protein
MAMTNQERAAKALDLLKESLAPFAERGNLIFAVPRCTKAPPRRKKKVARGSGFGAKWRDVFFRKRTPKGSNPRPAGAGLDRFER